MKVHGSRYQLAGLPDLLVIHDDGRATWIEVKLPGRKPSTIQVEMMRRLRELGCRVGVATSVDEALSILEEAA